jgi:PAS domain S-box-containing protein
MNTPKEREQGPARQLRIFLAGCAAKDEREVREILGQVCAEPSVEAIDDKAMLEARLAEDAPDLVLACDSGCELTAWEVLKIAGECAPRTAVIVLSHSATEKAAMRAIDLGAADYVLMDRPWEVSVAVRRALREYEQRQRRKEAEDRLRNHINLLQLQQVVATAANEALSPGDAAQSVLDISRAYGSFALAHLFYATEEDPNGLRASEIWSGYDEEKHRAFRAETGRIAQPGMGGMVAETLLKKELKWIADISTEPRFNRGQAASGAGLRSVVMVPVAVGSETLGVIEFFGAAPAPRDERLALVLEYIATQLGRVFERDRAERRLEQRAREQMVLAELSRKAVDVVNLDEFLLTAARRLEDVLPDCRCIVLEASQEGKALRIRTRTETAGGSPEDQTIPAAGPEEIGHALLHDDLLKIDLAGPNEQKLAAFLAAGGTAISAAIRLRNEVFGALVAYSARRRDFSRSESTFLRSAANVLATAAEHTTAFHQLQLLSSAVTQSQDSIMITDARLELPGPRILFVNPAFTQITGYRSDEVLGQTPRILQGEKTSAEFLEIMHSRLREGRSAKGETVNYRKDGSEFWVEMIVSPLRNTAGEITHFVGIQRDITERKFAEERLRESEEMLGAAQRVAHLGGWVLEDCSPDLKDGRLIWTEEVFRIFGMPYGSTELTNDAFFRAVHPDDREKVAAAFQKAIADRTEYQIDHRIVRPDGVERIVHEQATAIFDETGKPVRVTGTVQDITERKHAEEELRHWKERYDMLTKASGQIIFDWDVKTGLRTNGGDSERLLGCSAESLGTTIEDWIARVHPEDQSYYERELDRQNMTKTKTEVEYRLRRNDNTYITVKGIGYPMLDENGEVTRILGSVSDISSQRALEQQLRRSQKMEAFGKLAGGVAHDFNNLLTIITGYNDVLLSEMPPNDPNRECIEEIARAASRASALTGQLLAFSRQQKMQPRVVNMNDSLRDTSKMLSRLIGEDIEMRIDAAEDLGNVKADVGQIEQVVMNLAVNARDAMPGGGTITMSTRNAKIDKEKNGTVHLPPGEYVLLEVTDTGTGMSPEVQARIFEPFFTTKAPGQGTGLGLATCYGIVKQSGGEICVKSKVGSGTTFQIYLPRVYEEAKKCEVAPGPKELPTGLHTILVVEDEAPVRAIIRSILQRLKYTVVEAPNGVEALKMLTEPGHKPIDLLMTDLVMPEMGGKELVKQALAAQPQTRVIVISGYPAASNEVLPAGARFLPKPFTPKALAEAVRDALAGK